MRASDIVLDDERLGLAAKAVFLTIGMVGPACTVGDIEKHCRDEHAVVLAAVEELVALGYVTLEDGRVQQRPVAEFGRANA